ncbi:MAG TPA: exo-alpha-sialidase [Flavisolibacter sp.]|nr:exo-alpha-sialidase [Flavisolibacter sp.]
MKEFSGAFFLLAWMIFHPPGKISLFTGKPPFSSGIYQKKYSGIGWDSSTLVRISPPNSSGSYPRMIQLKNGLLLTAYASRGNIVIAKSSDEGRTWSLPKTIAAMRDAVNMDTPELLQLQNGNLLLCYATRPQAALRGHPDTAQKFEIRVQESRDGGDSWQNEKILYKAGASFNDGCWEPAAVQIPSGEIQVFFANEAIYTVSNEQNISMLRSADNGATWSAEPQIISFRKNSRDGMPVPLWLKKEKKIIVAIEDPGDKNFKPFILQSAQNGQWKKLIDGDDTNRWKALKRPLADTVYAGAPYLRQLPTGETILSYQSTEDRVKNRDHNAVMRVAVGDEQAKDFDDITTPFIIPEGYGALWSSLCLLKGASVIAVTSTNGYSKGRSEIWMIRGALKR